MAQAESKLIFGTATPGGGFPAYGWPYADVLNAADATLANTLAAAPCRELLHPGVLQYLRDAGLLNK